MTTERRKPNPASPALTKPGIDGFPRTARDEAVLNGAVWHTFNDPDGKATLAWLKSITTDVVLDPSRTDAELRHQEGMRHLVKLIETRIQIAERTPS